jgi:hypothetical protein
VASSGGGINITFRAKVTPNPFGCDPSDECRTY